MNEANGEIMKLDTTQLDVKLTVLGHPVHWVRATRDETRKTRVHVSTTAKFDVLEDLQNRTRRPYEAWRVPVLAVLKELGYENVRLRWSQNAGCSCGCSPGFIVEDGAQYGLRGGDLFITLTDAPSVDESKTARKL